MSDWKPPKGDKRVDAWTPPAGDRLADEHPQTPPTDPFAQAPSQEQEGLTQGPSGSVDAYGDGLYQTSAAASPSALAGGSSASSSRPSVTEPLSVQPDQDPIAKKFNEQGLSAIADYKKAGGEIPKPTQDQPEPAKAFVAGDGAWVKKPDGTLQDARDFKIEKDFQDRAPGLRSLGQNVQQYSPEREKAMRDAGTWTPDDEIRKNQSMYEVQGGMLRSRMGELSEKMKKAQAGGIAKKEQDLMALGDQIRWMDESAKNGQPVDPETYNSLVSKYNTDLGEYQSIAKPIQDEKADIDAGMEYLRGKMAQSIKDYAASPSVRESNAVQGVIDKRQKAAENEINKGNYLAPEVIQQYVINPVSTTVVKGVSDAASAVLRALDTYSNLPNTATGNEYYTPFAKAADKLVQTSDDFTKSPTEFQQSLFDDNWDIKTGILLPKVMQAATYMAVLGGAGAIGGEAAMVAASYMTTEEDYYREAIKSGLSPDQAQRFSIGAATLTSLLEKVNPGPMVDGGTVKGAMMKRAMDAIKGGSGAKAALKDGASYVLKESAFEGSQEVLQGLGDVAARNVSNTLIGDNQLDGSLNMKDLAEQGLLGAALGGLAAGVGRSVDSPLRKQTMDWAVRNEDQVREFIDKSDRPDKAQLLKNLDAISAVYNGNGLKDLSPEVSTKVASDIQAKQEVEAEIKAAPMDEALKAAKGDPREKKVEDLTRDILEAQGVKGKAQDEALVDAGITEEPVTLPKAKEEQPTEKKSDGKASGSEGTGGELSGVDVESGIQSGSVKPTGNERITSADGGPKKGAGKSAVGFDSNSASGGLEGQVLPRNGSSNGTSESDGVSAVGQAPTAEPPAPGVQVAEGKKRNAAVDAAIGVAPKKEEVAKAEEVKPERIEPDLTKDIPDDPKALAEAYHDEHLTWNSPENPESVMQMYLAGSVDRDSFIRNGDKNVIGHQLAKTYFAKKGQGEPMDLLAMKVSEDLGREVSEQDLVDFMLGNPSGLPRTSPRMREMQDRYKALTGKKLDKATGARLLKEKGKAAVSDPTVKDYIDGHTDQEGNVNWQSIKDEAHALPFLGYTDEQAANILAEADRNLGTADARGGEVLAEVPKDEGDAGRSSEGQADQERQALAEQVDKAKAEKAKFEKGFTKRGETLFNTDEVATKKKGAEPGLFEAEGDTRANTPEDLKKAAKPYDDAVTKAEQALKDYDEKVVPAKEKAKEQQTRVDKPGIQEQRNSTPLGDRKTITVNGKERPTTQLNPEKVAAVMMAEGFDAKAAKEYLEGEDVSDEDKKAIVDRVKSMTQNRSHSSGGGDNYIPGRGSSAAHPPSIPQKGPGGRERFNLTALVQLMQEFGNVPTINRRLKSALGRQKGSMTELRERLLWDKRLAEEVLGHEIGHYVDRMIEEAGDKKRFHGRIAPLRDFKKDVEGRKAKKELNEEAIALSRAWRGDFDKEDKYRSSSPELFADVMSAFFNNPDWVEKNFPALNSAFDDLLAGKPEFAEAYKELTDRIAGVGLAAKWSEQQDVDRARTHQEIMNPKKNSEESHIGTVAGLLRTPWYHILSIQGKDISRDLGKTRLDDLELTSMFAMRENAFFESDFREHVTPLLEQLGPPEMAMGLMHKYTIANRTISERRTSGKWFEENPDDAKKMLSMLTEEVPALSMYAPDVEGVKDGSEAYDLAARMFRVLHDTGAKDANGMSKGARGAIKVIDKADLGVKGDAALLAFNVRGNLLNTGGLTVETAGQVIDNLKNELGPDKFKVLEDAQKKLSGLIYETQEKASKEGLISKKSFDEIVAPNKGNYAPYAVLDHWGGRVGGRMAEQVGSAKGIADIVLASQMKVAALNNWRKRQHVVATLKEAYENAGMPVVIGEALRDARDLDGIRAEHRDDDISRLVYYVDGVPHVAEFGQDPGKSFEKASESQNLYQSLNIIGKHAGLLQATMQLYTVLTPGFWMRNIPRGLRTSMGRLGVRRVGKTVFSKSAQRDGIRLAWNYAMASHGKVMLPEVRDMVDKGVLSPPRMTRMNAYDSEQQKMAMLGGLIMAHDVKNHGGESTWWTRSAVKRKVVDNLALASSAYEGYEKIMNYAVALAHPELTERAARAVAVRSGIPKPGVTGRNKTASLTIETIAPFTRVSTQGEVSNLDILRDPNLGKGYGARLIFSEAIPRLFNIGVGAGIIAALAKAISGDDDKNKDKKKPIGVLGAYAEGVKRSSPYKQALDNVFPMGFYDARTGKHSFFWEHRNDTEIPENLEAVSLRIPSSEEGRIWGPLLYNMLANRTEDLGDPNSTPLSDAGKWATGTLFPGINPIAKLTWDAGYKMAIEGENPDDDFTHYPMANPLLFDGGWGNGRGQAIVGSVLDRTGGVGQGLGRVAVWSDLIDDRATKPSSRRVSSDKVPMGEKIPLIGSYLTYDNAAPTREQRALAEKSSKARTEAKLMMNKEAAEMYSYYYRYTKRKGNMDKYDKIRYDAAKEFVHKVWGDAMQSSKDDSGVQHTDTLNHPKGYYRVNKKGVGVSWDMYGRALWAAANGASTMSRDSISEEIDALAAPYRAVFDDPASYYGADSKRK